MDLMASYGSKAKDRLKSLPTPFKRILEGYVRVKKGGEDDASISIISPLRNQMMSRRSYQDRW